MNKLKPYLLIAPATLLMIFIMGIGIMTCISQSLGYFPQIGLEDITLNYYKTILNNKQFLDSLFLSLKTSLISSIIAVIAGVVLAYFMSKDRFSKFRYFLLNLPTTALMNGVSAVRCFVFYKYTKNNKQIPFIYLIIFILLVLILGIISYQGISSLIPITITIIYFISTDPCTCNFSCNTVL